jgi:hypothetical protein
MGGLLKLHGTIMPYCHQYLKIYYPEHLDCAVRLLAKEQFNARDAYPLEKPNQYNIDDSMNDVRAITDTGNQSIRLFCRYKKDIRRINQRVIRFADSHSEMCGVVDDEDTCGVDWMTIKVTWKK